jgi:hypothetical protein
MKKDRCLYRTTSEFFNESDLKKSIKNIYEIDNSEKKRKEEIIIEKKKSLENIYNIKKDRDSASSRMNSSNIRKKESVKKIVIEDRPASIKRELANENLNQEAIDDINENSYQNKKTFESNEELKNSKKVSQKELKVIQSKHSTSKSLKKNADENLTEEKVEDDIVKDKVEKKNSQASMNSENLKELIDKSISKANQSIKLDLSSGKLNNIDQEIDSNKQQNNLSQNSFIKNQISKKSINEEAKDYVTYNKAKENSKSISRDSFRSIKADIKKDEAEPENLKNNELESEIIKQEEADLQNVEQNDLESDKVSIKENLDNQVLVLEEDKPKSKELNQKEDEILANYDVKVEEEQKSPNKQNEENSHAKVEDEEVNKD